MSTKTDNPALSGRRADGTFTAGNPGGAAPMGERNGRSRHGLYGALTLGALPSGCSWVRKSLRRLQVALEQMTLDVHGKLGLREKLAIQSALRHELAAQLALRWLRLSHASMSTTERLTYLTTIAKESDLRDRALDRLKLDKDATTTLLAELYGPREPLEPIQVEGDATSAPGAQEGTHAT